MTQTDWHKRFEEELLQARIARQDGNEGKARVCARRAAGIVVGEYFNRNGIPSPGPSVYDRLISLQRQSGISPEVREIAGHLLLRVTPEFELPVQANLIDETRQLMQKLLLDTP